MAELKDIIAYILQEYPYKAELSNARVTKMVYLSDWKHSLDNGTQLSPITWYFDNYGPFVWDVKNVAEADPALFRVEKGRTPSGGEKVTLSLARSYRSNLTPPERKAIDHVIKTTQDLSFLKFLNLVYATYPVRVTERYQVLNLPELAASYRASGLYKPGE